MNKTARLSLLAVTLSVLVACSPVSINDYEGREPELSLENFFSGNLVAYGILRDRSGEVTRHFTASLKGTWQDDGTGFLDEIFWFNDGERQTRLWKMVPQADGGYIGTAGDVEGEATIQTAGSAINLLYRLKVPYKDGTITLSMDDWMYQVAPGVIMNETLMTKWGFEVGKLTLVIMQESAAEGISQLVRDFDRR
ncbi:MAG: hypothetical protein ACJA04_000277 [Cellvibrionaceae bacterium]|jgi:hypothetical protein